jgi:threonine dehydratase
MEARARISGRVVETPVIQRESFNDRLGCVVHFKCETMQRTGSFKFRGATHAVGRLDEETRSRGVATHSSGNHGAALALAAREAGSNAHVVVPSGANPEKRAAIARYGGAIVDCGETLADRESALQAVCDATGAVFVPPYDHPHIVAGQGTAALELAESLPDLDEVWVPVGGGGLASGTLLALAGTSTVVRGVEPALADDAFWSLRRGRIEPQRPPRTVADGLRTALGRLPFAIFQAHGLTISTVTEEEIIGAQRLLWQQLKLVVEASGAVPLAGLLKAVKGAPPAYQGRRIGVILSGGNVALP